MKRLIFIVIALLASPTVYGASAMGNAARNSGPPIPSGSATNTAAPSSVIQSLFTQTDSAITTFLTSSVSSLISTITPTVSVLMVFLITYQGFLIALGRSQSPAYDVIRSGLVFAVVTLFALGGGAYLGQIVPFVNSTPDFIANALTGGGGTVASDIDDMLSHIITVVENIFSAAELNLKGLMSALSAIFLCVCGVLFVAMAAKTVLIAKMMIAMLLSIGPLVIIGLLFKPTSRFFESWVSALVNYMMISVLIGAAMTMIHSVTNTALATMASGAFGYGDAFSSAALYVISTGLILQVPSLAAAISGGFGMSTSTGFKAGVSAITNAGSSVMGGFGVRNAMHARRSRQSTSLRLQQLRKDASKP